MDNDGNKITLNICFPGQYYDIESGLHYNYFRVYDPESGRYITSDPIGLLGGSNTYSFALGNPVTISDLLGLAGCLVGNASCNVANPNLEKIKEKIKEKLKKKVWDKTMGILCKDKKIVMILNVIL